MAKKRISQKRKKRNRKQQLATPCAPLCALGPVIAEKQLFSPIHQQVLIPQKQIDYSPTDKLVFATLGFIAGAETVYDINFSLRPNTALLNAFGYQKCADQSVIQQTLNAATEENVTQLESALKTIWEQNNLTKPLLQIARQEGKPVTIDLDLSGQPASASAEKSTKGYFVDGKNQTGRQLARVVVAETQEIVTESLYPGNTLSMAVFKPMIGKLEATLGLETKADRSRILLRLDQGFGTDENINYALWRGYHILAKIYSWRRSNKLAKSVLTWVPVASCADKTPREAGWVLSPHRYGRKTAQVAIRTPKKKAGYSYHILVTTDMTQSLEDIVTDYDKRSGAPESTFCQDFQGLKLKKRRKSGFVAQQMLCLLNQLAHNLIRWVQSWLVSAVSGRPASSTSCPPARDGGLEPKIQKTIKERGIQRFIRQILSLSGKVVFKKKKVKAIIINPFYPFISRIITAFAALLKPLKITVSLDEI